jgi:hypothetical protein
MKIKGYGKTRVKASESRSHSCSGLQTTAPPLAVGYMRKNSSEAFVARVTDKIYSYLELRRAIIRHGVQSEARAKKPGLSAVA